MVLIIDGITNAIIKTIPVTIDITCACMFIMAIPSFCEEEQEIKMIDGNVVSADWENSSLRVKWFHSPGEAEFEEETLLVPEGLKITKGEDTIGLMDLEVGDHVIVEYYEKLEMPTAKSIRVQN